MDQNSRGGGARRLPVVVPLLVALGLALALPEPAQAQPAPAPGDEAVPAEADLATTPTDVTVKPVAHDEEIRERLQRVLAATEWFEQPRVRVEEGIVFLDGKARTQALKKWAGDLARRTQDVIAVVNRLEVSEGPSWDFSPATAELHELWRTFIRSLPLFVIGLVILALSAGAGLLATRLSARVLRERIRARLLRNVITRGLGVLVFLFGTYIVLRVSGLTQLALTVVGGTGLLGLAVGIAFRDITENFLASILLSVQRPFETGDLVEIADVTGYVQQLNVRATVLMTLEGQLVQVPNSTVYKGTVRNFTANANRREDFVVGIGYDDPIDHAQEVARKVLADHPAVLDDPEPLVLADTLGSATVNLRVYFWLNGRQHSWLKVRSSVIRLIKRAFQEQGISMPDEAREVVFPRGVPIRMLDGAPADSEPAPASRPGPDDATANKAEGDLGSDAGSIEAQARQVKPLGEAENLLKAQRPAKS